MQLTEFAPSTEGLMDIEAVQRTINRSRASVYRYANTDPGELNPPFDPKRLNPEFRTSKDDLLMFHPSEVARFARDVLRIKNVTIEVHESPKSHTQETLDAILTELQNIRKLLLDKAPDSV
jgi:hypothetical protein